MMQTAMNMEFYAKKNLKGRAMQHYKSEYLTEVLPPGHGATPAFFSKLQKQGDQLKQELERLKQELHDREAALARLASTADLMLTLDAQHVAAPAASFEKLMCDCSKATRSRMKTAIKKEMSSLAEFLEGLGCVPRLLVFDELNDGKWGKLSLP